MIKTIKELDLQIGDSIWVWVRRKWREYTIIDIDEYGYFFGGVGKYTTRLPLYIISSETKLNHELYNKIKDEWEDDSFNIAIYKEI